MDYTSIIIGVIFKEGFMLQIIQHPFNRIHSNTMISWIATNDHHRAQTIRMDRIGCDIYNNEPVFWV